MNALLSPLFDLAQMPTPTPSGGHHGFHMITNVFHGLKLGKNVGFIGLYQGIMLYYMYVNYGSGLTAGVTAANLFFAATGIQLLFYSDYKLWQSMAFVDALIAGTAWTYPTYILGPLAIIGSLITRYTDAHEFVVLNLLAYVTGDRKGPFFEIMFEIFPWVFLTISSIVEAANYGFGLYMMLTTANTYSQLSTNWMSWIFLVLGAFNVVIDTGSLAFPAAIHLAQYL